VATSLTVFSCEKCCRTSTAKYSIRSPWSLTWARSSAVCTLTTRMVVASWIHSWVSILPYFLRNLFSAIIKSYLVLPPCFSMLLTLERVTRMKLVSWPPITTKGRGAWPYQPPNFSIFATSSLNFAPMCSWGVWSAAPSYNMCRVIWSVSLILRNRQTNSRRLQLEMRTRFVEKSHALSLSRI
jgi:hypothetical protein